MHKGRNRGDRRCRARRFLGRLLVGGGWCCRGWSSRGGLTKNPYVYKYSAGGSSSGSSVSIATNLATISLGTETMGSIIGPGALAGVLSLKPSPGSIQLDNIIKISDEFDTVI